MPRPSKKAAEDKSKGVPAPVPAPAPVAAAPPPMPQPMMPAPAMQTPPGMMPQGHHQAHPQMQPYQQQPHNPLMQGGVPPGQMRVIDNESFLRVRDSAVGRLGTILELLRSFTQDYIRQTNLLLGEPTAEGAHDILSNFENAAAQLISMPPTAAPAQVEAAAPTEEKKERKKRTHDPNAPKRPLTPYFLYMQNARQIIANDLGPGAPKGAVQEEGQRRWAHMDPTDKQAWNHAYQWNLRLYNARVHSYKAGNVTAKDMSDDEARDYADRANIPNPEPKEVAEAASNDQDAIAQQLQQVAAAPAIPNIEDEAKTPKKPASRKRKTATPGNESIAPAATPATAQASPDKKRRRQSGA
ncbi:hypothetical protein N3K66_005526 [Trichothecium roseum]|uniref:Uncharacterized protein n=1 Tax=Trichothecium roseum TaxID=47278 RepID=A0ACC0UYU2_9HYPO|nr:hypothetical protein N3K66_005526 [Trichothecium roseum]